MKTTGVPVVLLLAAVHVFTPVSPDDTAQGPMLAMSSVSSNGSDASVGNVTAPPNITIGQSEPPVWTTEKPSASTAGATAALPATGVEGVATSPSASTDAGQNTLKSVTLEPRFLPTTNSSKGSEMATTQAPLHTVPSHAPTPSSHPATGINKTPDPVQGETTTEPKHDKESQIKPESGDKKGSGSQTGSEDKGAAKSDKSLWWILLPVLLVGAAAAIILKFRSKKINDHTETIDTGTENASFQSRPESTKDGVMLLGIKSSGGDENAAGR